MQTLFLVICSFLLILNSFFFRSSYAPFDFRVPFSVVSFYTTDLNFRIRLACRSILLTKMSSVSRYLMKVSTLKSYQSGFFVIIFSERSHQVFVIRVSYMKIMPDNIQYWYILLFTCGHIQHGSVLLLHTSF